MEGKCVIVKLKNEKRRKKEERRGKTELNWGQIDSSRESLHSIWRLPNRVRLTPFKTLTNHRVNTLKSL